jgi:hypothetical protein
MKPISALTAHIRRDTCLFMDENTRVSMSFKIQKNKKRRSQRSAFFRTLHSDPLSCSLASIFPKIDGYVLGVAVDLVQFSRCKLQLLNGIQGVVQLLDIAGAN